jgi:phosphoglycolate phosphatase-like HAD superfamily hydrolase
MIELVVLDCDGVILESVEAKTQAFVRLMEGYGPTAVDKFIAYHLANNGVSRFEKFAWFYRTELGREITPEQQKELGGRFTQLCYEEVLAAPFVPGIYEFLEKQHRAMPIYVASGTPHGELNQIFQGRKLTQFFKGICGTPPGKTDLLAKIVKEEGVNPAHTLMVGDSSTDMEAAENVGTLFYGRGESFASTNWPWGADLNKLDEYISLEN